MSAPFDPGDVVVCVDDVPDGEWARYLAWHGIRYILPMIGKVYRIAEIWQNERGFWGVLLHDFPTPTMPPDAVDRAGFAADRFRKIDDEVTDEFREQLSKLPVLGKAKEEAQ